MEIPTEVNESPLKIQRSLFKDTLFTVFTSLICLNNIETELYV